MEYSGGEELLPAERASAHLEAVAKRWWLVVCAALTLAVLAYALSWVQQARYDATAKVLVTNAEPVNLLQHATGAQSLDPERDLNTSVELVKLDSVAAQVKRRLRLSLTPTEILREVRAAPVGTTNVIAITARDWVPKRAAKIANAFAAEYVATRRQRAQGLYARAADGARRQLAVLGPGQRHGALARALLTQLHEFETTGSTQTGGAQVVDAASTPTTPATPRPKFAAAVGGFVGLLLGLLAALIAGASDRRRAGTPKIELRDVRNGSGPAYGPNAMPPVVAPEIAGKPD
jgi:uncharacterized protein involved in exopolysaccharide biosynthesis